MVTREVTWRIHSGSGTHQMVSQRVETVFDWLQHRQPAHYAGAALSCHSEENLVTASMIIQSNHRHLITRWIRQADMEVKLILRQCFPGVEIEMKVATV